MFRGRGEEAWRCIAISMFIAGQLVQIAHSEGPGRQPVHMEETSTSVGQQLVKDQDCSSCHALDHQLVGPSYEAIATKYANRSNAIQRLSGSIRSGEIGTWGDVPMTPHPGLSNLQLREMVRWILSVKPKSAPRVRTTTQANRAPSEGSAEKLYAYKLPGGKTVKLSFALFEEDGQSVTKDVFRGYELYNSYCYRCHGQDVTESELAPDLRKSLNSGMTLSQFMSITMAGRDSKGMPGWAGFFSEEEMSQIFIYIEGRRLELVPVGRPRSSEQ